MSQDSSQIPQAAPSRRQRKAQATRVAIIDAALTAFERQPIGLVSVLDITEAADVSKGVFYLHFRSKDEFLLSVRQLIHDELLEAMSLALQGSADDDLPTRLRSVIGCYYDTASPDARRARYCLRLSSYLPDEIGPPGHLCALYQQYLDRLAETLDPRGSRVDASAASCIDATCWSHLWQPMRRNLTLPPRDQFVMRLHDLIQHEIG